jgi:tetratricopeptide (TPR) repeat protein
LNRDGEIVIGWDPRNEPGAQLSGREFGLFPPKPNKFYLFQTGLDIEAPPGYAIRVEPHPRFYTDDTGMVPAAVIGHVQTEWWAKTLFCVFKVPAPGQRHIFRKGDPYASVILVPHAAAYEVAQMDAEQETRRAKLDRELAYASPYIAKSVWFNRDGDEFRDHYRVMERAYMRGGQGGLDELVNGGVDRFKQMIPPPGTPIEDCLSAGYRLQQEGHFVEARTIYQHVLSREPNNDQALSFWSILAAETRASEMALQMMRRTVELRPDIAEYHANLGRLLLRTNRAVEAEPVLRKALELSPNDPKPMSDLAIVVAQQGRVDDGLQLAGRAAELAPNVGFYRFHVGVIYANVGKPEEARRELEKALELDPNLADARRVLDQLPGAAPAPKGE